MSILSAGVVVAALIATMLCLRTAHGTAATATALAGVTVFVAANVPVPDSLAPISGQHTACQPDTDCRDNPCR